MQKFFITFTLCILPFVLLEAQNSKNYKYIDNLGYKHCYRVLEINNRYYISSWKDNIRVISVFDEDLNQTDEIQLFANEIPIYPSQLFYEEDTFYVIGWVDLPNHTWETCFAKFDKDFNLVDSISIFYFHAKDTVGYDAIDVLKTKSGDFILLLYNDYCDSRLLQINNNGEILQDVVIDTLWVGYLIETDSNYSKMSISRS